MLHSIKNLIDYTLGATDGEVGKIKDFYFDDQTWEIRYLIVETGGWLFGRKVLISPVAITASAWDSNNIPVNLTIDQIKHSPDIDTNRPVSRQQEAELHGHYSWPEYGGLGFTTSGMVGGVVAPGVPFEETISNEMHSNNPETTNTGSISGDHHLRSIKHIKGHTVYASDEEIGEVEDFLIDDKNWEITFMVVNTGTWFTGKKILITPKSINRIEWSTSSVYVDNTRDSYKNNPEVDYDALVKR